MRQNGDIKWKVSWPAFHVTDKCNLMLVIWQLVTSYFTKYFIFWEKIHFSTYFEIRPIIFGDVWAVALRQHHNLLLYVLNLIFRLFEIDDLNGHDLLSPVVDAFEDFAEATLSDSLLFCKYQLGIHLLQQKFDSLRLLLFVIRLRLASLLRNISRRFRKEYYGSFHDAITMTIKQGIEKFRDSSGNRYARLSLLRRGLRRLINAAIPQAAMQFSLAPFYEMTHDIITRVLLKKKKMQIASALRISHKLSKLFTFQ